MSNGLSRVWLERWPDVRQQVLFVAVCSRCGRQADHDGFEYSAEPQAAIDNVLSDHADETFKLIDGRLVCEVCVSEGPKA